MKRVNRAWEPGWELVIKADARRGLWFRISEQKIEVCSGREGDDEYFQLKVGDTIQESDIKKLEDCLSSIMFSIDNVHGTNSF